jgi:pimeloyl-ACP methyl ester carboxylesterase
MRPLSAPRPTRVVVAAAAVAFVAGSLVDPAVAAQEPEWIPPVGGAVVRPFVEPIAQYAAGHRGVDFAASPGTAVRASNHGTVSFAGSVAGALHVVVAHEGGIRTSYSFLSSVDVRAGQQVRQGQVVGRAGGAGDGHGAGVLHFGVRIGDRYVDPMLLFRPRDLTQIVRLVPPEELAAASEPDRERDLLELARMVGDEEDHDCSGVVGDVADVIGLGGAAESACDALEEAVETAWRALLSLGEEAEGLVESLAGVVTDVIDRMRSTGETLAQAAAAVAGEVAEQVERVIEAAVEYARDVYERLTSCPQPTARKRIRGSGNVAWAIGGYDSQRRTNSDGSVSASFRFRASRLGYGPGEVEYASYSASGEAYSTGVTHQDLNVSAARLAAQLRAFAREHPLQPIDLIAHSQGGVVLYLFLADFYVGHEHEYPRVENVVTYGSPLEGTPLTNLQGKAEGTPVESLAGDHDFDAKALEQLREGSPLVTRLKNATYPRRVRYLSLAGSEDPVVPSTSSDPPRGDKYTLPVGDTWVPDDHTAILRDDDALSAAQAHLSGGAPVDSCGPLVDVPGGLETAVVRGATAVLDAARGPGSRAPS